MSDEIIVTIVGIALIGFVLWFFLAPAKGTGSSHEHHDH
jgi:plastocyanin domain-containing protein